MLWRQVCRIRSLRNHLVSISNIKETMEPTHDDEEDGQHDETHELDGFTTPGINEKEGDPVSWNQAGSGEDQISFADVV